MDSIERKNGSESQANNPTCTRFHSNITHNTLIVDPPFLPARGTVAGRVRMAVGRFCIGTTRPVLE